MKNLLLGSAALIIFSCSMILFQISCKKDIQAQTRTYILPTATTTSLGGVIVGNGLSINSNGVISVTNQTGGTTNQNLILTSYLNSDSTIAIYDYNGNLQKTIELGSGRGTLIDARFSSDGTLIFFRTKATGGYGDRIFKMKSDGSAIQQIIDHKAASRFMDIK